MKRVSLLILFLLPTSYCLLTSIPSARADSVIFEFAPDPWESQRFAFAGATGPVYEVFQAPADASLTGIDLWVDNTGSSGPVTLTLFDSALSQLGSVTASVTHLSSIDGGHKVHFDLQTGIPIIRTQTYYLQISSSLTGLGLYTADRILILEHNRAFTNEYVNGTTKIGQDLQSFTFKFALYAPISTGSSYNSDPSSTIQAVSNSTSTVQQQENSIIITNARIATSTATTVTLAWTTNIATDARVGIRTQLNPAYVVASSADETLELEHLVTVSGLQPSISYFADMFSSPGNQLVLTTYTIAFKTAAGTVTPPPTAPPTTPPTTTTSSTTSTTSTTGTTSTTTSTTTTTTPGSTPPPSGTSSTGTSTSSTSGANPTSSTGTATSTTTNATSSTSSSGNSGTSSGSSAGGAGGITADPGNKSDTTKVSWPSFGGGGASSYRIDIFDADHNLERSIKVPAGTNSKDVAGLLTGQHTIVVYAAKDDGTFEKVAAPLTTSVTRDTGVTPYLIFFGIFAGVAGIIALVVWKFKKEKSTLPEEEGYDPDAL